MLACLKEAFISADDGLSPEALLAIIARNQPTEVYCRDLPAGTDLDAPFDIQRERLVVDTTWLSLAPSAIADLLLEGVALNNGFDDLDSMIQGRGSVRIGVAAQLSACARNTLNGSGLDLGRGDVPMPAGTMRSALPAGTALAAAGGLGGGIFDGMRCPSGLFATGRVGQSDTGIDRLALRCGDGTYNGPTQTTTSHGGAGGDAFSLDCGVGRMMVGVRGRADETLTVIGAVCADVGAIEEASAATRRTALTGGCLPTAYPARRRPSPALYDSLFGPTFERLCPVGMAVRALRSRRPHEPGFPESQLASAVGP